MARSPFPAVAPPRRLTLSSTDELQSFCDALARRHTAPRLRLGLSLIGVRSEELRSIEVEANRLMRDTGWRSAVAVALGLIALSVVAYLLLSRSGELSHHLWLGVALVLSLLAGATGGTFLGRVLAHRRLRRLCHGLLRRLPAPKA